MREITAMSRAWKGKWICTAEFSELIPRNVYHKELSPALYRETAEDPQDIHVMFRRRFELNRSDGRYVLRISAENIMSTVHLSVRDRRRDTLSLLITTNSTLPVISGTEKTRSALTCIIRD